VGVIAATVARGAPLLAATASRRFWLGLGGCCGGPCRRVVCGGRRGLLVLGVVGGQGIVSVVDLGTASKEPMAEVADFGLQECDLGFESVFALAGALAGALVEGFVKGGVASGVDKL